MSQKCIAAASKRTRKFLSLLNKKSPMKKSTIKSIRQKTLKIQNLKNKKWNNIDEIKTNIIINGKSIQINIIKPKGLTKPTPAFFFIHGGGFVLGEWPTYRRILHDLVISSNTIGIHINYSLSPESKYPTALNEIIKIIKFIHKQKNYHNIDTKNLAIVGNSSGGTLATLVTCKLHNIISFKLQCLLWPLITFKPYGNLWNQFSKGYGLTDKGQEWLLSMYFKDNKIDKSAIPMNLSSNKIKNMPKTIIFINGNDILKDQNLHFANILDSLDVDVTTIEFPLMIHDFAVIDPLHDIPDTKSIIKIIGNQLNDALY